MGRLRNIGRLRAGGSGFNPLSLFAAGEQGGWYDPSDIASMFSDSAGTTPAVLEGPVGKINDKSGRGNHLIQATAASRPTLSARYNKLTSTEDLSAWSLGAVTVTPNVTGVYDKVIATAANTIHFATSNAGTIPATVNGVQTIKVIAGELTKVGIRESGTSGQYATFDLTLGTVIEKNTAGTATITSLGGGVWQLRVDFTGASAPSQAIGLYLIPNSYTTGNPSTAWVGDGVSGLYAAYADLRTSTDLALNIPTYQRVDTASSYDTSGFPMYLSFDGVDDAMATGAVVDYASATKLSIFAGVTKSADLGGSFIVEHGVNGQNAGCFGMILNGYVSNGTKLAGGLSGAANDGTVGSAAAVVSAVFTMIGDTTIVAAASAITLRKNGAVVTSSTTNLSVAGSLGSQTTYVAARTGTSLWIQGRIYQLILRGAASSAAQIASAETFTGSKMGIAL